MSTKKSSQRHLQCEAHAQPIVAETNQLPVSQLPADAPLPRPKRQKRREKEDRGLPPDYEIARLATEYLRIQQKLWPKLVSGGMLANVADTAVADMVADFKLRHRGGAVETDNLKALLKFCGKIGGNYNRFSCDNSSPTSIIDQMAKALEKARQEDRFVPWAYVFCDYSVSGLTTSRQGYTSYKDLLSNTQHLIETTYVDDFSRASRDEIEWWRLAWLSKRFKKRMIGASDGFDLSGPNWDMMITLFGLLSRLFIKSLREKVTRGMRGAARRRTCLGKQSLGFTRCVSRDDAGAVIKGPDDRPIYKPCIDPNTCEHRKLLYELFVDKKWSAYQIAKHFNQIKVDGWDGWTEGGIKKLLWSPTAIGVFTWNRTRREFDREEEKWVTLPNPRSQWEVYYEKSLAIVSIAIWKEARKRLLAMRANSPLTGKKQSRNQISATTLFSGTLVCGYCGKELLLCRSTPKYKVIGCPNGRLGAHGCKLATSKSTRIIETCLLNFLRDRLVTAETIEILITKANEFLAEEAAKPRSDTTPLKAAIREKETLIKRQFKRINEVDDECLRQAYEKNVSELQKEVNQFKMQLRDLEDQNVEPPAPLDLVSLKELLPDMRTLLNQEIPAAADAIRSLTGPISIKEEKGAGKTRGAKWIATFSPSLLGLLRQVAKNKDCPETITLEFLSDRIWTNHETVTIEIDHLPQYEEIAAKVAEMAEKGTSVNTIAATLGVNWKVANDALVFAETGVRPVPPPPRKKPLGPKRIRTKVDVAAVVEMHDQQRLSFKAIAEKLGVSQDTVARAYDRGNPAFLNTAAETGNKIDRGHRSHLPPEVFDRIRAGIAGQKSIAQIALDAGCSQNTVRRAIARIKDDDSSDAGPLKISA